jgi:2-polyprenyl-6-methoxyphenol hydroxylase-like FAD-dependent oxidoreductase
MKIRIVGAGPAGLHFSALMKRQDPSHEITLYERSPREATWGFGVVFSDRALDFLQGDDRALYEYLAPHMESWNNLTIARNDTRIPIAGNGFTAIGRLELLTLLYGYVERLGVEIQFETEITAFDQLPEADLIVAANGVSSWIRDENAEKFGSYVDWRPNKFMWCGTSKAFDNLTLTFRESEAGVFCAHHYRYSPDMSTFLLEVQEETWARAGFDNMSAGEAINYCEKIFASDLDGRPLVSNNSHWRNFPDIGNERWSFDNVVLMGDALRTVHFSIGSGTRMAMEDAIALAKAFRKKGDDIQAALAYYHELRFPPMKKVWDASLRSLRWYENMDTLVPERTPVELAYSYMTRTGRVKHGDVKRHEPELAGAYEKLHPEVLDK